MAQELSYIEISSTKRLTNEEETTFVKIDFNPKLDIISFYGDKQVYSRHDRVRIGDHAPKSTIPVTISQFFQGLEYKPHRQIYEEAKQKLKEEMKK